MARFLSDEWLGELAEELAAAGPFDSPGRLALGQVVTGGPMGQVGYTLLLGAGEPSAVRPGTDDAEVTIVEDYEAAVAIASGAPASGLLGAGRVKVRGDASELLGAQELLAAVGPALASFAGSTQY